MWFWLIFSFMLGFILHLFYNLRPEDCFTNVVFCAPVLQDLQGCGSLLTFPQSSEICTGMSCQGRGRGSHLWLWQLTCCYHLTEGTLLMGLHLMAYLLWVLTLQSSVKLWEAWGFYVCFYVQVIWKCVYEMSGTLWYGALWFSVPSGQMLEFLLSFQCLYWFYLYFVQYLKTVCGYNEVWYYLSYQFNSLPCFSDTNWEFDTCPKDF